jgi:hypothetical protein
VPLAQAAGLLRRSASRNDEFLTRPNSSFWIVVKRQVRNA